MKILIVEDIFENVYMLETLLKGDGYEIETAQNGVEALEKLKTNTIDLIISDILMPKMDGFQLCKTCKSDENLRNIPFIFYTATYTDKRDEEFALSLGAEKFLVKPADPEVFLSVIKDTVMNHVEGKVELSKIDAPDDTIFLENYNKRLINKLEQKMLALEKKNAELKGLEENSRKQSDFLHNIIESLTHPFYVINTEDYKIAMSNTAARSLGVVENTLCHKSTHDNDFPCDSLEHPCPLKQVIQSKKPVLLEHLHRGENGEIKTFEVHGFPVFDNDGNVVQMIEYSLDVSDRKIAEEALRESELKYRSLIEQSNDIIYLMYKGKFEVYNQKLLEFLGITSDEIESDDFDFIDYVAPESRHIIEERDKMREQGNKIPHQFEFTVLTKAGTEIEVEASIKDIPYLEGIATQAIVRDISERKKLEDQLRQAQKMEAVGRLAGGIAHDFNNLLTVISGNTDILKMGMNSHDPNYADLEDIDEAAKRAADLTRQLLAFSRKQTIELNIINLNTIISSTEKMLRRLIGEDMALETNLDEKLLNVIADPGQIDQVLVNLAINARDAMPGGGKFIIETQNTELDNKFSVLDPELKEGAYVLIEISDTGCGMDEETKDKIFEPFYTTKEAGKGTGLGLSTVYGIIKQHQGYIAVYSELGLGTTFRIYLPGVDAEPDWKGKKTYIEEIPKGSERVMVVEDDKSVRKITVRILQGLGYTVIEACNGEEAIEKIMENDIQIDLILTDLIMPGIGGAELKQKLREKCPGLKVLYMSGYTSDIISHHGIADKDSVYLKKPFLPKDLAQKVREVLDD